MDYVSVLWNGEKGLAKTFYGFWLGGTFFLFFFWVVSFVSNAHNPNPFVFWGVLGLAAVFEPFILISIWKSAGNYITSEGTINFWGYLARLTAILAFGYFLYIADIILTTTLFI